MADNTNDVIKRPENEFQKEFSDFYERIKVLHPKVFKFEEQKQDEEIKTRIYYALLALWENLADKSGSEIRNDEDFLSDCHKKLEDAKSCVQDAISYLPSRLKSRGGKLEDICWKIDEFEKNLPKQHKKKPGPQTDNEKISVLKAVVRICATLKMRLQVTGIQTSVSELINEVLAMHELKQLPESTFRHSYWEQAQSELEREKRLMQLRKESLRNGADFYRLHSTVETFEDSGIFDEYHWARNVLSMDFLALQRMLNSKEYDKALELVSKLLQFD